MARKSRKIQQRNVFAIFTNGKESEFNYLNLLKSKKSIYEVSVKFQNSDPLGLVQFAYTNSNNVNQIWCVFDVDNSLIDGRLKRAINFAKTNNINLAISNKAFEVWLLSHYDKMTNPMDNKQLCDKMDSLLKTKLSSNSVYKKGEKDLLEKYFLPNLDNAVSNSKIVFQEFLKKGYKNIYDMNPCTTMFKLIEALKLQGK